MADRGRGARSVGASDRRRRASAALGGRPVARSASEAPPPLARGARDVARPGAVRHTSQVHYIDKGLRATSCTLPFYCVNK